MTNRHNLLRNAIYEACRQASLSVRLEVGGGLGRDKALTRPADILVSNPSGSASAAYDITVTSPLNPGLNHFGSGSFSRYGSQSSRGT